jgi:hypothetical protein
MTVSPSVLGWFHYGHCFGNDLRSFVGRRVGIRDRAGRALIQLTIKRAVAC